MSHSQFRRIKTYTETCMDESLRQAYDYWQDQPGSIRRCDWTNPHTPTGDRKDFNQGKLSNTKVLNSNSPISHVGRIVTDTLSWSPFWQAKLRDYPSQFHGFRLVQTRNASVANIDYAKRTNTSSHEALMKLLSPASLPCIFTRGVRRADHHFISRRPNLPPRAQANLISFQLIRLPNLASNLLNASRNFLANEGYVLGFLVI